MLPELAGTIIVRAVVLRSDRIGDGALGFWTTSGRGGEGARPPRRIGRGASATEDRRRRDRETIEPELEVGGEDHGVLRGIEESQEQSESVGDGGPAAYRGGDWPRTKEPAEWRGLAIIPRSTGTVWRMSGWQHGGAWPAIWETLTGGGAMFILMVIFLL